VWLGNEGQSRLLRIQQTDLSTQAANGGLTLTPTTHPQPPTAHLHVALHLVEQLRDDKVGARVDLLLQVPDVTPVVLLSMVGGVVVGGAE